MGVDALVLDTYLFYAELVPLSLGMPYVHVSNALHFDCSGYTPLPVYDWPHETGPEAIERNRKGVADFLNIVNKPTEERELTLSGLDSKSTGKIPEPRSRSSLGSPKSRKSSISRVLIGRPNCAILDHSMTAWPNRCRIPMGTIDWRTPHLRIDGNTAEPCGQRFPHNCGSHLQVSRMCRLVLSLGEHVDPKEIGPLPTSAITVKWAPQLELLKRASVCITHAGLNTVLEALAQGVPRVAIPVTNDQPGVAARIADKKTGLVAPLKDLTAPRLSGLVDEVLTDPRFRNDSCAFQKDHCQNKRTLDGG